MGILERWKRRFARILAFKQRARLERLEGIVRARQYVPGEQGKQFLGATVECSNGTEWVIDYDEQSPFHRFANCRVLAWGEPYQPEGQVIGGNRIGGHFRVATMRPMDVTPDVELREVGPGQHLRGRFERGTSETGESILSFVTEKGDAFLVANDPAGATVGRGVEVWGYPVQRSPSIPKPPGQYVWIICPCSAADLWKWRERHS